MIDFHCHLAPNVDDGACSVQESIQMLESLENQGVRCVVATPHYYGVHLAVNDFLQKRDAALSALKSEYKGNVKIVGGSEINLFTCLNADLADLAPLAIEGTRYALVEASFEKSWGQEWWNKLDGFVRSTRLIPVIAHVEKYPAVWCNPSLVCKLIEHGCLIQVNCDSLTDGGKFSLASALLKHGNVHFLGTDAHNVSSRPPKYSAAAEKIAALYGTGILERLKNNAINALSDAFVTVEDYTEVKKISLFKFYV